MADEWKRKLRPGSWGGVTFGIHEITDEIERDVPQYEYVGVDGADTSDQGAKARVFPAVICFYESEATPDPWDDYLRFEELIDRGQPQVFMHPLRGPITCRVPRSSLRITANGRGYYLVQCVFLEHSIVRATFVPGPGASPEAAAAAVAEKSAALTAALDAAATAEGTTLTSTAGAEAEAAVGSWLEGSSPGDVDLQLAALAQTIDAEMDRLGCATDIKRYEVYSAFVLLQSSLVAAAETIRQTVARVIDVTVPAEITLLSFVGQIYPASEVSARYAEIIEANAIPNPLRLERGQVLRMPAPETRPRTRAP